MSLDLFPRSPKATIDGGSPFLPLLFGFRRAALVFEVPAGAVSSNMANVRLVLFLFLSDRNLIISRPPDTTGQLHASQNGAAGKAISKSKNFGRRT